MKVEVGVKVEIRAPRLVFLSQYRQPLTLGCREACLTLSIWLPSGKGSWTGSGGKRPCSLLCSSETLSIMPSGRSSFCSLFFKKEMELSLIGLQNAGKTSLVNVLTTGTFHEDMIPTVGFNMRKHTKGSVTIKLWDLGGQVSSLQSPVRHTDYAAATCPGPCQAVHVFRKQQVHGKPVSCQLCKLNAALAAMPPTLHQRCMSCMLCRPATSFIFNQLVICCLQPRFRSMWERYCRGVQAIVYVVDSADHDTFDQARQELHDLLAKPSLARIPLLVLGNKNDLPDALSTNQIIEHLDLKVGRLLLTLRGTALAANTHLLGIWLGTPD